MLRLAQKTNSETVTVDKFILLSLVLYLPFHLFEEWAFGFPAWAEAYWRIPDYTVSKWLLHNVYFSAALLLGLLIYWINKKRFLVFGLGIIMWGIMNAVNHLACSIIFMEYEPGIVTGLLWIPLAAAVFRYFWKTAISLRVLIGSIIVSAIIYWTVPIVLFIEIDKLVGM